MDVKLTSSFFSMSSLSALTVGVAVVLLLLYTRRKHHKNQPPGPRGYPIIGNLLDIPHSNVLGTFRKLQQKYGDLFTIYLGKDRAVVINGYDNIRELLAKKGDATSYRPPNFIYKHVLQHSGVSSCSGYIWKIHRAFAIKTLRGFGLGKRSLESNILEDTNVFLEEIEKQNEKPFNIDRISAVCVSNVICSMLFGEKFDFKNTRFKTMEYLMEKFMSNLSMFNLVTSFPFLKYFPGDPFTGKLALEDMKNLDDFIQNIIDEHKSKFDPENVQDYIDMYLKEQTQNRRPKEDSFTDKQLRGNLIEIFIGGAETTSTTLKWFILFLLHNPRVQTKMLKEMEAVVGVSKPPSLDDKPHLPYCEAVITETMRCATLVPICDPHYTSEDVYIHNYIIPKGTVLLPNLDSVMMDSELFPDPTKFYPERYIEGQGKLAGHEKVIAFSIGRRMCFGESIARAQLFLFSTSLVQRFKLLPTEENSLPPLEGHFGLTYAPHPFNFRAVKRQ